MKRYTSCPPEAIKALRIDRDRLWQSHLDYADIGPGKSGGCNRQALTKDDGRARDIFIKQASEIGCEINIDQIGNIFARYGGSDRLAAPVATGSHLDTQASGGRFDGVFGVLSGLEVLRTLSEASYVPRRPIEVIVWTNEEGCRFAPAMLGSGVMSGYYELDFAYSRRDKDGFIFKDELEKIGYLGELEAKPRSYAAMIEAHIEQGPILESEDITIGVVTGIQGAYWLDITVFGSSCHAGPTPMEMRKDPWLVALPAIRAAYEIARQSGPEARCTIGELEPFPGARNTMPGSIRFSVDLRHPDLEILNLMLSDMEKTVGNLSQQFALKVDTEQVWHMPPTAFDERICASIERATQGLGHSFRRMVSGAGHDSLHTAKFAPTAMIFVPCKNGLSHNEAEFAKPEHICAGADVLLHTILDLAN